MRPGGAARRSYERDPGRIEVGGGLVQEKSGASRRMPLRARRRRSPSRADARPPYERLHFLRQCDTKSRRARQFRRSANAIVVRCGPEPGCFGDGSRNSVGRCAAAVWRAMQRDRCCEVDAPTRMRRCWSVKPRSSETSVLRPCRSPTSATVSPGRARADVGDEHVTATQWVWNAAARRRSEHERRIRSRRSPQLTAWTWRGRALPATAPSAPGAGQPAADLRADRARASTSTVSAGSNPMRRRRDGRRRRPRRERSRASPRARARP